MISILGCGWLGMPLGKELAQIFTNIKGSTTKQEKLEEIHNNGLQAFNINLFELEKENLLTFLSNEILVINIPPGRGENASASYLTNLNKLNLCINESDIKKVIFISSTSVYKENNGVVYEDGEISKEESGERMYKAENIFRNNPNIQTTIVRMSGLIGPNRHPGRFFSGKENIPNGGSPINLIHLDDCIGIIKSVITKNYWGETINASSLTHPTKKDFYSKATQLYNGTKASFREENLLYKIINSDKLINDLQYAFKHPDLMEWLDS